MQNRLLTIWLCASVAFAVTIAAQEGHPLVGSWHGDWALGGTSRQDLTVIFEYTPDGADVTGLANPGYDHAALQKIQVTIPKPTEWQISFEVELKDKAGKTTRYAAHGTLDKIGSDRRTLTGSWSSGAAKGDFKLTRDRDYSR